MNKQVTFGHILTVLAIILIPLLVWGVNIERRFEKVIENAQDIDTLENDSKSSNETIQENHLEVMAGLHKIELEVVNKKDRE